MKRLPEMVIVVVACALLYRQSGQSTPQPVQTPSPVALSRSDLEPIAPPPGVHLYECPHGFAKPGTQKLFQQALQIEGPRGEALLEQALAQEPDNPSGYYHLSFLKGVPPERQIRAATRALEMQPGFARAWNTRAYSRAQTNDSEQWKLGLQDVRHALGLSDEATFYDTRGYLLLRLGRAQDALYDVEKAVRDDASEREHWEHRAMVYEALGRAEEAIQDRQRARSMK